MPKSEIKRVSPPQDPDFLKNGPNPYVTYLKDTLKPAEHDAVKKFGCYLWLNSDFIPRNGKIFEFPKNFIAI